MRDATEEAKRILDARRDETDLDPANWLDPALEAAARLFLALVAERIKREW